MPQKNNEKKFAAEVNSLIDKWQSLLNLTKYKITWKLTPIHKSLIAEMEPVGKKGIEIRLNEKDINSVTSDLESHIVHEMVHVVLYPGWEVLENSKYLKDPKFEVVKKHYEKVEEEITKKFEKILYRLRGNKNE